MTERDGGNLFDNIKYELDEITIAFNQFCGHHRAMRDELIGRNPGGAAQYAAHAAAKAGEMQTMLGHIATVLQRDGHAITEQFQETSVSKESVA